MNTESKSSSVPPYVRAVLSALNFRESNPEEFYSLSSEDWRRTLDYSTRSQLNGFLLVRAGSKLPNPVRERLERDTLKNVERWHLLKRTFGELSTTLEGAGIQFAVLKGFSHYPMFVTDPRHRTQYDIDLLLSPEEALRAAQLAATLGYEAISKSARARTDHLPTMVRKTGWIWRNDYYDPELPFSLELHSRCWNKNAERFGPTKLESILRQRLRRYQCEELRYWGLHPCDAVLYAGLHIVRHLLHGNLKTAHVYEMGSFLHRHSDNKELWEEWERQHDREMKAHQGIAFALAHRWFGCTLHPSAQAAINRLSPEVRLWLDQFAFSPLVSALNLNKDELWLHWALVGAKDRPFVIFRKLFPMQLPGPIAGIHAPPEEQRWQTRIANKCRYLCFLARRLQHHLCGIAPVIRSAVHWFEVRRLLEVNRHS